MSRQATFAGKIIVEKRHQELRNLHRILTLRIVRTWILNKTLKHTKQLRFLSLSAFNHAVKHKFRVLVITRYLALLQLQNSIVEKQKRRKIRTLAVVCSSMRSFVFLTNLLRRVIINIDSDDDDESKLRRLHSHCTGRIFYRLKIHAFN